MFLNSTEHLRLLGQMKSHALDLYEAIQCGNFDEMGRLVGKTWQQNKALDAGTNPPAIEAITGITTEMVRFAPNPRSVLPDFLDFVGDDFVVGHNVNFDVRFVAASADFFRNDYIDTMAIFRKLHSSLPHHRLSDMVDFCGKKNDSAHRALSDCFATQSCFEAMRDEVCCLHGDTYEFLTMLK
jgi:DNA polymerase III epsilon subunit-like protein